MKFTRSEIMRLWPIAKRVAGAKIVRFVERIFSSEKIRRDVFGRKRDRKVLICYLPEAFKSGKLPLYHSNLTECRTIGEVFDSLGYSVDCASRGKHGIDYSRYDVVLGINCRSYWDSFTAREGVAPIRIFYSVGAHTFFNFRVTAERCREFFLNHGRWMLPSCHYVPGNGMNYYMSQLSDAVILLGDGYLLEQYKLQDGSADNVNLLSAFYFPVSEPAAEKDFSRCRNNLLWFGSSGMVHKGLDIAIDFAVQNPSYNLHICGGSRQEKAFWDYYTPIISAHRNIHYHGFVDIESQEFRNVLDECGILVNPSISEGGAVSVLNVLGNGALLPVCSRGTGLDLSSVGVEVADTSYDSFCNALSAVAALPVEIVAGKAWEAHSLVKAKYSLENYRKGMQEYIKSITENKK